ncbi:MAG: primosomal protein N' [Bacteroidales bacterium]|nr:primosomal protein N' [Bacteroidales bacterium]MCL2132952.1 primosomal protein N' [Bacteroidales bacterium]
MKYVHVIFPLALPQALTYSVPPHLEEKVAAGMRVQVDLGRKQYQALVQTLSDEAPKGFEIKPLKAVIDNEAIVGAAQLRFWEWVANYYMCTVGEVMTAALPNGLRTEYKPRFETFVRLHPFIDTEEKVQQVLQNLSRAKKQEALLMDYLSLALNETPQNSFSFREIPKKLLHAHTAAAFNACVGKDIFEVVQREVSRLDRSAEASKQLPSLSPAQDKAYKAIKETWNKNKVALLHGVTASGKTEVYAHLMAEQLQTGKQALYLVPEIALTAQLIARLERLFGNAVVVYHSRYSDEERVEIYNSLRQADGPTIIVGTRSALFLPFRDLGMVIVDEEHESSYKQQNPAPRYHARDSAIVLAAQHGAKVLLGTATPAVETYCNVQSGKYGCVTLAQRYYDVTMPTITVVDTISLRKKKRMQGMFSLPLVKAIEERLARKEQIILFQNRRGFSPFVQCGDCGHIPQCKQCSVNLTYHKYVNSLQCHYCGYSTTLRGICHDCGSFNVQTKGFGTEKIEEELQQLFPAARLARLDLDATRKKNAYQRIISDFEEGRKDILIGTQMVTKGLDFSRVSLVGILNADNLLNFPDFRAHERSFHLLTQVSGRAGRKDTVGQVIIQTGQPNNPIIHFVQQGDYHSFFHQQLAERKEFAFPPYSRLIALYFKHRNEELVQEAAVVFKQEAQAYLGARLFGPLQPVVHRVQNQYILAFWIRSKAKDNLPKLKQFLLQQFARLRAHKGLSGLDIIADVDPQ